MRFAKYHWAVLILSFVIGSLIILPTVASIIDLGLNNFKGVYPTLAEDEVHYLANTKEVSEGHSLANAFLKEHKDEPYLQPALAETIFAKIANWLNISIPKLFFFNDFLLPFIGVILLYFLFFFLIQSRIISLFFTFFYYLIYLGGMGRPINQQFSILFVFIGLSLIRKIFTSKLKLKELIIFNSLLGLVLGSLVYIYPYYWTTLLVVYGLCLLVKTIKEKNLIETAKNFIVFFIVALTVAAPYLINLHKAILSPFYNESALRLGMISTHWPGCLIKVGLAIITGLIFIYIDKRKIKSEVINYSYILLASVIILNWQNIITGKYLQFSSHYNLVSFLLILIVLAVMITNLKNYELKFSDKKTIWQISAILLLTLGALSYLAYANRNEVFSFRARVAPDQMLELQKSSDLFDWFNTKTPKDSAVYYIGSDSAKEMNFTIYSNNNLYYQPYAAHYLMSDDELENRWLISKFFTEKIDGEYIKINNRGIWMNKFVDVNQNQGIRNKIVGLITRRNYVTPEMIPTPEYIDRVLKKNEVLHKEKVEDVMKKYDIDYIVLDISDGKYKNLVDLFRKYKFMKAVKEVDNNIIYKVNL